MRRSAAPSQMVQDQPPEKRPRFQPPFVNGRDACSFPEAIVRTSFQSNSLSNKTEDCNPQLHRVLLGIRKLPDVAGKCTPLINESVNLSTDYSGKENSATEFNRSGTSQESLKLTPCCTSSASSANENNSTMSLKYGHHQKEQVKPKLGIRRGGFRPPTKQSSTDRTLLSSNSGQEPSSAGGLERTENSNGSKYYNVMWCKYSKKKHKKWEGDAILIVTGGVVCLKDMDGKDIGKGSGYKRSELSGLSDGSTLVVGGKELEIVCEIIEDTWKSGKCFTGVCTTDTTATPIVSQSKSKSIKKFVNPCLGGPSTVHKNSAGLVLPLHNPELPNALVMPRPNSKHQILHNQEGLQLVEVVVDPHLSVHLRPHQREGVVFLYECISGMREYSGKGAILADEMGLGKTLQCITTLWTVYKQGPYGRKPLVKKTLIITPGSLVKNWEKEFKKWLGSERIKVFSVSSDKRVENPESSEGSSEAKGNVVSNYYLDHSCNKYRDLIGQGSILNPIEYFIHPVLIISYEMFLKAHEALYSVHFDLVICDEGHRLKNIGAKTTSLIMGLSSRRRIVLTGTPIQNDLQEFYSLIEFCNPAILGSHSAFKKVYEEPIVLSRQPAANSEEKDIGEKRADELKRLTSLFCLRRTQEINKKYLPPKVESVVFCKMSSLQLQLYKHLLNSRLVKTCFRRSTTFSPHLVCISALKKLCNSPSFLYDAALKSGTVIANPCSDEQQVDENLYQGVASYFPSSYNSQLVKVEDSGKLLVLSELLHYLLTTTTEKIVIISNYTQALDMLQRLCDVRHYGYLRLDGSTPASKRMSLVEAFNSKYSAESIFLLSSKAGGVGLNLIGASRLILYDIDWNPANDLQAMARVWRDGQQRKVHIYRLITTGTIEEKIFQRQISKQGLNSVVDFDNKQIKESNSVKFSTEDLKDLFTFCHNTTCETHDLLMCNCGETEMEDDMPELSSTLNSASLSIKNASMDELLQWQHFREPVNQSSLLDKALLAASQYISFVFRNESVTSTCE